MLLTLAQPSISQPVHHLHRGESNRRKQNYRILSRSPVGNKNLFSMGVGRKMVDMARDFDQTDQILHTFLSLELRNDTKKLKWTCVQEQMPYSLFVVSTK